VTDNGSCYQARGLRCYIASRPEFEHVCIRHRSPETNGVIERWFQSLKYEHLYLHELDDGLALAEQVAAFERIYITTQSAPHEAIDFQLPRQRYLQLPGTTEQAA
jgi:putative transposase